MRAAACEASAGSCVNAARDSRVEVVDSAPAGCGRDCVNFKCLRIDDHAVIPSSGVDAHVTLQDILPDTLGVAV